MSRINIFNPFYYIAGLKSLLIGVLGLLITTYLAFITGTHYNGLRIELAKDSDLWIYFV